ncbi:proline racemase [Pluteus cervinus]|uniref:Proline racemase n=1 Tax=Pluteus cervinus TaxID=181527 RepID=A0ACD3BAA7_9AGAR|nr:proline racemase [Pluteus cervinus]
MDVFQRFVGSQQVIHAVDMHTSGEPTRIVIGGFPPFRTDRTLLDQRDEIREKYDYIRRRLMLEPRGHKEMYGAILIQETELTKEGKADIGVLFCHNEGYSTMCGHATLALGRFLVDTSDLSVFPRRNALLPGSEKNAVTVRLHVPCGLIQICVPTRDGRVDVSRPISYRSVPSYVTAVDLEVSVPVSQRWKELSEANKESVRVSVAYGGAFYVIVEVAELGFTQGLRGTTLGELDNATRTIKQLVGERGALIRHPDEGRLEFLYGVMVTEVSNGKELGVCFFANQQVDRSPTGSCVSARVALAVARGELETGGSREYDSLVSSEHAGMGFKGTAIGQDSGGVVVEVSGYAYYTAASAWVVEAGDALGNGFEL